MPITRETVWRLINICLNLFLAKHLDIFLVSANELLCNLQQTISSRGRLGDGWGPVGAEGLGFPPPTPAHSGTGTCTWKMCQATLRRAGIQFRGCAISDEPCHLSESVSTTVMVITESWTIRRAERRRNNWCFWTVVLEETLESPVDSREIKPVHPKGNQTWIFIGRTNAEAEAPLLWPPDAKNWLTGKDPDAGKDWGQEKKGVREDEMTGWHNWLSRHEFEQALGYSEGQRSLACCSSRLHSLTWLSNWTTTHGHSETCPSVQLEVFMRNLRNEVPEAVLCLVYISILIYLLSWAGWLPSPNLSLLSF